MKYRVSVTPQANRDLVRLAQFLAEKSERSARKASAALKKAIRSLDRLPHRAPVDQGSQHILNVKFGNSGYAIWYSVVGDTVTVSRIFHMREDRE